VPDGIESWRLSIDPATKAVTVFGGVEKDEAAAQAQKEEERIALVAENAAALAAKLAE
jgi:nickel-dependent lactate racemase